MDAQSRSCATVIIPALILYALLEIRRGWRILRYEQISLNLALTMRVMIIRAMRGREHAEKYEAAMRNDRAKMKLSAWYGLAGGVATLIIGGYLALVYFGRSS